MNICFYDIETPPYRAWVWGCGDQFISHSQLDKNHNKPGVICLSYAINKGPVQTIDWGYEEQDSAKVVREFDKIIDSVDVVIGKNSDRFDNKMINTIRAIYGLEAKPYLNKKCDDLEKQLRKYFKVPSQSLDYWSSVIWKFGGKNKMEFQDWIDIVEKNDKGLRAFNKMRKYNRKDVADTQGGWYRAVKHFEPRFHAGVIDGKGKQSCRECGSTNLAPNGHQCTLTSQKRRYKCLDCQYSYAYLEVIK